MKRYSLNWWLVYLPTSVVVGGTTLLFTGLVTEWGLMERLVAAVVCTLVADLAIAASIEAVAPTWIHIGPGEKMLSSELPSETATVIDGFGASTRGRVMVRGETWLATRAVDDIDSLRVGMDVKVIARDGLTLVVSANTR